MYTKKIKSFAYVLPIRKRRRLFKRNNFPDHRVQKEINFKFKKSLEEKKHNKSTNPKLYCHRKAVVNVVNCINPKLYFLGSASTSFYTD